jgi:Zn-dependent peptidase ImmA (M78 family)
MKIDLTSFKAPYFDYQHIKQTTEKLLKQYGKYDKIPIDIDHIVEFDLGIDIIPINSLKSAYQIESWLSNNQREIYIDLTLMERYENRYRYTLAHEVGHLILHSNIYKKLEFESIGEWKDIIENFPANEYGWIETHAYDFAGLLLVPEHHLRERYKKAMIKIEKQGYTVNNFNQEILLEFITRSLTNDFNVSESVIRKRLIKENLNI